MDPNQVLTTIYFSSWQYLEEQGVWEWMELYHPRARDMNLRVKARGITREPYIVFTVAEESLLVAFRLYFSDKGLDIMFR